ncbi:MAG: hypothetical protein ACJAVA_000336 [Flavobacteriaceae bacterium]|jgi:hypothetical protein
MVNWIYNGTEVKSLIEIEKILGYRPFGFIYKFTLFPEKDENVKIYFGQKTLLTDNKRIVGQRELKERGKKPFRKYKSKKGTKKDQWIYFEEGLKETWIDYNSSSDEVKELVASGVRHTKEIIEFVQQKALLNWKETVQIICSGCLESEDCLNKRVGNYFAVNIIKALKKEK